MAFFQLALKARKLEKARLTYEDEKLRSIEISGGAKPRYTLKQRIRRQKLRLKKKIKNVCAKIFAIPKDSWIYRKIVDVRTDGTLENYIAKSFAGFLGGIFLTYIFFGFFVIQLGYKLSTATFLCSAIGVILTLGLAFSPRIRCIVFLLLPQFFSKRGRQVLVAYAFILALTGPVKNTLHNIAVLTESLACAQEQLKEAVKTVIDLAKQPFYALRDAITKVIKSVKAVVKRIKQTLLAIKRIVLSILRVITSVFQWLGSVINMCNKKLGTPFDRCQRVFDGAVADCKAKLGPFFGVVCNITYVVSTLCYIVKPLDFICMLVSYVADTVVGAVKRKIKRFTMHMKAMFYVKVKFSHSFHFETNQSKSLGDVSTSIATEIRSRTDTLFTIFDSISFVTSLFVFIIVLRVMRYRFKWMTSERYDNKYITKDLRTIDLIRARQDKETVLPLNPRESHKYVSLSSVMLVKSERLKLVRSAVFLGLATVKLIAFLVIDYSLYWVLNTIQIHGRFESKVEKPSVVTIHVAGEGYMADLYRSIVRSFSPQGKESEINTMLCLPQPVPPNLDRYTQIVGLLILCWFVAFFEPYGLRLRHVVLCQYYPDRAKQRATWLYNHIIRSRGNFLKFARRQLRRKFGMAGADKIEKISLQDRLWAVCPCLNILFPRKQKTCLLCSAVERSDIDPHIKCPTPGCVGLFCPPCFADLQNICTICRSPIDYGDLSDLSEELDSSEDDYPRIKPKPIELPGEVTEEEEEKAKLEEEEEEIGEEDETERREEAEEEETEVEEAEGEEEVDETTEEESESEREKRESLAMLRKKVEEDEEDRIEKEMAQQTEEKYEEDTDSVYSYAYEDEIPEVTKDVARREPFKDVEAQRIRDDVTIQIFNEPLAKESCSCDESPASCFVVRARRRVRSKLKKSRDPRGRGSDSSHSIADTESWSTEEIDEEEVIHVEVDDECEELLKKDRRDQEKRGRINKIVGAVARIPWLGRGEDDDGKARGLRTRRPSLMSRIVGMLQGKSKLQTYRRSRKIKGSSSSSSSSCYDESETLLRDEDVCCRSDAGHLTRRRVGRRDETDDTENFDFRHPREKKFATRKVPKYLESTVRCTSYYEMDETENSQQVEDVDQSSDMTSSKKKSRRDTTEDEFVAPCSCTSDITQDTKEDRDVYSHGMSTITERTDSSKIDSETEKASSATRSDTENTDETESPLVITQRRGAKDVFDDSSELEDVEESGETGVSEISQEEDTAVKRPGKSTTRRSKVKRQSGGADEGVEDTDKNRSKKKGFGKKIQAIGKLKDLYLKKISGKSDKKTTPEQQDPNEVKSDEKKTNVVGKLKELYLKREDRRAKRKKEKEEKSEELEEPVSKSEDKKLEVAGKREKLYSKIKSMLSDKEDEYHVAQESEAMSTDGKSDDADKESEKAESRRKSKSSEEPGPNRKSEEKKSEQPEPTEESKDKKSEEAEAEESKDKKSEEPKPKKRFKSKKSKESEAKEEPIMEVDEGKEKEDIVEEPAEDEDKTRKVSIDTKVEPLKIDKATDLPDRSRHTQTKIYKRDSRKISEKEVEAPKDSEKEKETRKKSYRKKKESKKSYKEDKSPKDRKRRRSKKEEEDYYPVKDKDEERKRKARTLYEEEQPGRYKRKCSKSRRHKDVSEGDETRRYEDESEMRHRHSAEYSECFCGECRYHEHVCQSPIHHDRTYQHRPCQGQYSELRSDVYGHSRDPPEPLQRGFEMPMVRKYLPMFQSPELIEELKAHDRMKLIREREATRRSTRSSPTSARSKMAAREPQRATTNQTRHLPGTSKSVCKDAKFAYQETQAYRNVLRELEKRTRHRRLDEEKPLIHLSQKADRTKRVKQLYPPRDRSAKSRDFANRVISSFKPRKRHRCNRNTRDRSTDRVDYDPELLSNVSCYCSSAGEPSDSESTA
ncbi:uncharacterized protein LOC144467953 [Augochlora pura]